MFDYDDLAALDAIIKAGSFDRAAKLLYVSQSAVSQRIRRLEEGVGQPLLVRTNPPSLTKIGETLRTHFRQVHALEEGVRSSIDTHGEEKSKPKLVKIAIAVNVDNLVSWLLPVLKNICAKLNILIDVIAVDQDKTIEYLRSGYVFGSISSQAAPLIGCNIKPMGAVHYYCVCSPEFKKKYLPTIDKRTLSKAPAIHFSRDDKLHLRYLREVFHYHADDYPYHVLPSGEGFLAFTKAGLGYAMIPHLDIRSELINGTLIELKKQSPLQLNLYWHQWNVCSPLQEKVAQAILQAGAEVLKSISH